MIHAKKFRYAALLGSAVALLAGCTSKAAPSGQDLGGTIIPNTSQPQDTSEEAGAGAQEMQVGDSPVGSAGMSEQATAGTSGAPGVAGIGGAAGDAPVDDPPPDEAEEEEEEEDDDVVEPTPDAGEPEDVIEEDEPEEEEEEEED